jgi:hypothetical protein
MLVRSPLGEGGQREGERNDASERCSTISFGACGDRHWGPLRHSTLTDYLAVSD